MTIQVTEQKGIKQLFINDEMTIYTALEQKKALLNHLKAGQTLQINLSAVSEIDSAGLQILLFIKQQALKHNISLALVQHSQAVVEVFELLDLSAYFGDPIIISANWKS